MPRVHTGKRLQRCGKTIGKALPQGPTTRNQSAYIKLPQTTNQHMNGFITMYFSMISGITLMLIVIMFFLIVIIIIYIFYMYYCWINRTIYIYIIYIHYIYIHYIYIYIIMYLYIYIYMCNYMYILYD